MPSASRFFQREERLEPPFGQMENNFLRLEPRALRQQIRSQFAFEFWESYRGVWQEHEKLEIAACIGKCDGDKPVMLSVAKRTWRLIVGTSALRPSAK